MLIYFKGNLEEQLKGKLLINSASIVGNLIFFNLILPYIHLNHDFVCYAVDPTDPLERKKDNINKFREVFLGIKNNPNPKIIVTKLREVRRTLAKHDYYDDPTFYIEKLSIEQAACLKYVFQSEE